VFGLIRQLNLVEKTFSLDKISNEKYQDLAKMLFSKYEKFRA